MNNLLLRLLLTIDLIRRALADVPTETGYHLFRDKVAIKARRLFRIPHTHIGGRHLEKIYNSVPANVNQLSYGTWQKSNGRKSFPEVQRVYSFPRFDADGLDTANVLTNQRNGLTHAQQYYSWFKSDMGKYGWWRLLGNRNNWGLDPNSLENQARTRTTDANNRWGRVRARFDSLTGDCSHKMHYRRPYMIIICYNQNAIHNTHNHPMVYDYYINLGNFGDTDANVHDTAWDISGQNLMNFSRWNDNRAGAGGHGFNNANVGANGYNYARPTVNFNHRIGVTTVWAARTREVDNDPRNVGTWWTVTWNGPYEGQTSQAKRTPWFVTNTGTKNAANYNWQGPALDSGNVLFFRPHNDFAYLKTCRVTMASVGAITDVVQPNAGNRRNIGVGADGNVLMITYIKRDSNRHTLARCTLSANLLNTSPLAIGAGASSSSDVNMLIKGPGDSLECFSSCTDINFAAGTESATHVGAITTGGIKYVRGNDVTGANTGADRFKDYIIAVNSATNMIHRCTFYRNTNLVRASAGGAELCVRVPTCPEDPGKRNFGYFSECRDTRSCGIYYMGRAGELRNDAKNAHSTTRFNLMNRVYCADILKFNGTQPLYYRRHFTANEVAAHDVNSVIQSGVDSEANSMSLRSFEELYMYNSHVNSRVGLTVANREFAWTGFNQAVLRNREASTTAANNNIGPYAVTGRVVRAIDPNKVLGQYHSIGYYNHSYSLPYRRGDWAVNAPKFGFNGVSTNNSVLLLNDVHMDNTEDWTHWDQHPMGHLSLRLRRGFGTATGRHLEMSNCTTHYHNIVKLNCTYNKGGNTRHNGRIAVPATEHIKRVWWFDESVVVQTTTSRRVTGHQINNNAFDVEESHLYAYRKRDSTWTKMNFGNYATTAANRPNYQPKIDTGTNPHRLSITRQTIDSTAASGVLEFLDVAEHEGDLIIAFKRWSYAWITKPIEVRIGRDLRVSTADTYDKINIPNFNYNPNDHRTGINRHGNHWEMGPGWTSQRFFPLEDDSCVTGFNIVTDISWRIRFLLDCNKVARNYNQRARHDSTIELPKNNVWGATKWIGDYWIYDNQWVTRYRNIWNVSLINSGTYNPTSEINGGVFTNTNLHGALRNDVQIEDYFGKDFEYGCATKEYVFVFDPDVARGWVVAAVHIHDHSMRFFELNTFGITSVTKLVCVGDYVVGHGRTSQTAALGALFVLYGTNIEDARMRIHSIEKLPVLLTSVSPTLVDDKIWIRCVANNRAFQRVAFVDGPIVRLNSTKSYWSGNQFVQTTNGAGSVANHPLQTTFVWANNIVNVTNLQRQPTGATSYNLDNIATIKGHVYGMESYGENSQLTNIRQRVYFEKDHATRRRILQPFRVNNVQNNRVYDSATYAVTGGRTAATATLNAGRNRFYELKIKNNQMARLQYVRGYSTFRYYENPETLKLTYPLGYECEKLDFTKNRGVATNIASYNYLYWVTECQETHYKEVRIYRDLWNGANRGIAQNLGRRIIHNDVIHKMTIDAIRDQRVLMTFYNENEHMLNMSIYDFSAANSFNTRVVNTQAGVPNNYEGSWNEDAVPISSHLQTNVVTTPTYTMVVYAPRYGGLVRVRYITNSNNAWLSNTAANHALFNVSEKLDRIKYCHCTNNEVQNEDKNISCVFIGYDRYFYQYTWNYTAANAGAVTSRKRYDYFMYKDYEPEDIKIGSEYIIIKARSRDHDENTVLTYQRVDKGGFGYLYSGLNGTKHRFNDQDWKRTRVELAEYGGAHKIYTQRREDTKAKIFAIDKLRVTHSSTNNILLQKNCLRFIGAERTECLNVTNQFVDNIPNQNGAVPPKIEFSRRDFYIKLLLWILAALILLGVLAYIFMLLKASPKPGGYSTTQTTTTRPRGRVVEERVYDSSTNRHLEFEDDIHLDRSQEDIYGDSAL